MNRSLLAVFLFGLVISAAHDANAGFITSTFDTSTEGWTDPTAQPQWIIEGFLEDSNKVPELFAPAKFLGNLSAFNGGSISYSFEVEALGGADPVSGFGQVTIVGTAGLFLTYDPGINGINQRSGSVSVPLTTATFGVSDATLSAVLADVTSITIFLNPSQGPGADTIEFDNFTIASPVPEPSSFRLAALGTAVILLAFRARPAAA